MSDADPFGERVVVVPSGGAVAERVRVLYAEAGGMRMGDVGGSESRLELIGPKTVGSLGIHLSIVQVPFRYRDTPHFHVQGEKVMYITKGSGILWWGADLEHQDRLRAGDAVYVPPYAIHAPENDTDEIFELIMVTNAPLDISVQA